MEDWKCPLPSFHPSIQKVSIYFGGNLKHAMSLFAFFTSSLALDFRSLIPNRYGTVPSRGRIVSSRLVFENFGSLGLTFADKRKVVSLLLRWLLRYKINHRRGVVLCRCNLNVLLPFTLCLHRHFSLSANSNESINHFAPLIWIQEHR